MPRRQHKYHFIYKTTCLLDNKFYIGMHSTSNMNDGYMGSGKRIRYSINKHGAVNHKIEHLEFFENREELRKREAEIVNESLLQDPLCMNLYLGGNEWKDIAVHREQWSSAQQKGRDTQLKLWKERGEWYQNYLRKSRMTFQMNNSRYVPDWNGRHHTEETKRKMSIAHIGKHNGETNSQYGTCWVYSITLKQSKRIKKTELSSFLEQGWCLGRKMKF